MRNVPEAEEPMYCDSGHRFHGARCDRCEADYRQGAADADAYHAALQIGGEDLAARMELEAEYGFMG
jgi:hypothetical protein